MFFILKVQTAAGHACWEMLACWFAASHSVHVTCFKCIEQPWLHWASWTQPHFKTITGASQWQRPHFPATFRCIAFGRTVVPLFFIVPPTGTLHFLVLKYGHCYVQAFSHLGEKSEHVAKCQLIPKCETACTVEWSSCSNWETLRVSKDSRGTLLHSLSRFWKFPITKLLAKEHWGELVQWHARNFAAFGISSREDSSRGRIFKNTWNYSELCGFTRKRRVGEAALKLHQWNEIIACLISLCVEGTGRNICGVKVL